MQRGLEIVFQFSPLYSLNPSSKRLNEAGFLLIGWVLMLEHFHLLIKPEPAESTSGIMRELKKRSAQEVISILCENQRHAWRRKMLNGLRLPPTVHCDSYYRVWQRRFYPYGV